MHNLIMRNLWKDIWRNLRNPIQFPATDEVVVNVAATGEALLNLAEKCTDQDNVRYLAPYIGQLSSLLDVLNLPLVQIAGTALPFIPIATGLLKYLAEQTKQQLTLEIGVALASQVAYLKSLQEFLENNQDNLTIESTFWNTHASDDVARKIRRIGTQLEFNGREIQFGEDEAKETLDCFHESPLAKVFNQVLNQRFQESGLSNEEAQIVTERVSRKTYRYLKETVAQMREKVPQLLCPVGDNWYEDWQDYESLERYLENQISPPQISSEPPLHGWQVFDAFRSDNPEIPITIQDLYVPLKAQLLDRNGYPIEDKTPIDLATWAENSLNNPEQKQVIFIQAGPGRGKSIFCQLFANWVRENLHPIWTPILIRLRDVKDFNYSFEITLREAVDYKFARDDWLNDRNTRFLFLLDGFDELLLEQRSNQGLNDFLDQVEHFQTRCNRNHDEMGHRVLITGRPLALQGIERLIPDTLIRLEILPFDKEQQRQWLNRWGELRSLEEASAFQEWLEHGACPKSLHALALEPLLLYLLAAMHRDENLTTSICNTNENHDENKVKIRIYKQFLDWVLRHRPPEWLMREPSLLDARKRVLEEIGLCVTHSGGECAAIKMIEERLNNDDAAKQLLDRAREQLKDNNPIKTAMVNFWLQPPNKDRREKEGSVEFIHKSFGEFLCAERLKKTLQDWARSGISNRPGYYISDGEMDRQIYDLLGFGGLTQEIIEYLMGLLTEELSIEELHVLFERLEKFYIRWSQGEFIELINRTDDLPAQRTREFKNQNINLGQRKVDIYTGLNVLILLLKLHSYAQTQAALRAKIIFYPCGQPYTPGFDKTRLLRIINYSNCLRASAFTEIVGRFLSHVNLSGVDSSNRVDLGRADLSSANLRCANLSYADLRRVDLSGADLSDATLYNAYLRGADLSKVSLVRANLISADLCRANLDHVNLTSASLQKAKLNGAYLNSARLHDAVLQNAEFPGANLSDIEWDNDTIWYNIEGLHKVSGIPELLQKQTDFKNALEISKALEALEQKKVQEAKEILKQVEPSIANQEISAKVLNRFCWLSCLYECHDLDTIDFGLRAVNKDRRGNYQDSLAVAYAMGGEYRYACELFKAAINSQDFQQIQPKERRQKIIKRRREWIEMLDRGQNPFTHEVLEELRQEEG